MTSADQDRTHFVVTYRDPKEGKIMELRCGSIRDSSLGLSFVSISDFIFDTSRLVVKPEEEQLKKRFENVKALHLSIYSIISIEEVGEEHKGLSFQNDKSNLVVLPKDGPSSPPGQE